MNATIEKNQIPVVPTVRMDDGSHWLTIDIPNGWDDVKKLTKKVLSFEGRRYTFSAWNSDTLRCYFRENNSIAKIS